MAATSYDPHPPTLAVSQSDKVLNQEEVSRLEMQRCGTRKRRSQVRPVVQVQVRRPGPVVERYSYDDVDCYVACYTATEHHQRELPPHVGSPAQRLVLADM